MENGTLFTRNGRARRNTWLIWQGPSRIDGSPIAVFLTGIRTSNNVKTGAMLQTHIIRTDVDPVSAVASGADVAMCGGCPLKGKNGKGRACYVKVFHAPLGIFKAFKRGTVPTAGPEDVRNVASGRMVRLGSYGDPAAVPVEVWRNLVASAAGWTGYTHQANRPELRDVLEFCQVSADSLEDAQVAAEYGHGSFRVLRPGQDPAPFEMLCPASKEAGAKVQCIDCKACSGATGRNVAIAAHGNLAGNVKPIAPRYTRGLALPVL